MIVVRGTRKFLQRVGRVNAGADAVSDTVLGDWFATVLFWRPQVALFVSKSTLLPVFVPFAPASTILERFPSALAAVLETHGVARPLIDREVTGAGDHLLATTNDRSVVGVMTEFARLAEWRREEANVPEGLLWLSVALARTPCGPLYGRHVSPDRELHAVLAT